MGTPRLDVERYRVPAGTVVDLANWPTSDHEHSGSHKNDATRQLAELNEKLADLQNLLAAGRQHKVLVVLQGMDTSGKDSTIKHVFRTINPLGVTAINFKRPNDAEAAHDYLWRVHQRVPEAGRLTIFNRSHYEDVLVPRVHRLVPEEVWRRRYGHIADFERMLADEGTIIRKFFLHISRQEQRRRLEERLRNPRKQWKFQHGDLEERKLWDDYQLAYAEAISRTSTEQAPWYIVPADHKPYRNLVVSTVLIEALESLGMSYPRPAGDLDSITVED
ncbi:PPK2 family polyphosphate kinase [Rhabdothermincola sp.]|uniref:PPK2 family polyphosphate kinase n=1 Tax=Rhabdothermincola sp. TaxID=2820405 RepID=UPI002FE34432